MSAVGVALVAATALAAVAVVGGEGLLIERHRLEAAADSASLAAADVAAGFDAGVPCDVAARVVAAAGGALESCLIEGTSAVVRVAAERAIVPIAASAKAGQPPGESIRDTDGSKK